MALAVIRETLEAVTLLLAPIVPHAAEELWQALGHPAGLGVTPWPSYDTAVAAEEEITIVIQVNGKVRSRLLVAPDEDGEEIKKKALADEKIGKFTAGQKIVRIVYVPQKLVNIVVQGQS